MGMRDSKRALAEVATMLGTDTAAARSYLRRVQHLAGPTSYETIAAVMRRVDDFAAEQVAAVINAERPEAGE